ncbi:hypothetical protein [Lactococcus lactis]
MKTFFRNVKVLLLCLLVIAIYALMAAGLIYLMIEGTFNQWVWSGVIFLIFIILVWFLKWRVDWKHGGILFLVFTSFIGSMLDLRGNPIYNEPIKLFYQNQGKFEIVTQVSTINGSTGIDYHFNIINQSGGVVKHIPIIEVIIFRFFEYLILYSIILSIMIPTFRLIRRLTNQNSKLDL